MTIKTVFLAALMLTAASTAHASKAMKHPAWQLDVTDGKAVKSRIVGWNEDCTIAAKAAVMESPSSQATCTSLVSGRTAVFSDIKSRKQ